MSVNAAPDAVVIGAGPNGLAVAALLAGEGLSVLVLESRVTVGGTAATEDAVEGVRFDTAAHRIGWLHPAVDSLLRKAPGGGPELLEPDLTLFAPLPDGGALSIWRDPARTVDEIRRFSPRDATRWPLFAELVAGATELLEHLYRRPPPEPLATNAADLLSFLRIALRLRGLGRRQMTEVLRLFPMSLEEWLDGWFESEELKGALAGLGVTGSPLGPMAPGTAFNFLHQQVGSRNGGLPYVRRVVGGVGRLTQALESIAKNRGARIRTGVNVTRILTDGGRVRGVRLADDQEIETRCVISSLDPHRTFLQLLEPASIEPGFLRTIRHFRVRGVYAKVNLALAQPPAFRAASDRGRRLEGLIRIGPDLMGLERAADDAKYGRLSEQPQLEITLSSTSGRDEGPMTLSALVQYAPYALADGVWDARRRDELCDRVVEGLESHAPGIGSLILGRRVLSPADLEDTFGLTGGDPNHGEMSLDQILFMRPAPGWARYRTPVEGLFLCGAGTHPGGGVTGAPGANAATVISEETRVR